MQANRLQLVTSFHQPVSATQHELTQAFEETYQPFLVALEQHKKIRVSLHFGGHLLEFMSRHHEDYLIRLKKLVHANRVEVLGGLFYGGIASLLPEQDIRGQIEMLREFWESFVGEAPSGFWLPKLAWTQELPRLFLGSGLNYGYVAQSQLVSEPIADVPPLGVIERADSRLAAFVLDERLSCGMWQEPISENQQRWLQTLNDRFTADKLAVINLWARGESFSAQRWFAFLEAQNIAMALPKELVSELKPAPPLCVRESYISDSATDIVVHGSDNARPDRFMCCRMWHASNKLRDAIAMMQDEELEEQWSDKLATVQREVFSAQTSDVYLADADAAAKEVAFGRLVRSEKNIDELLHKTETWLRIDEGDFDADLSEDIFVTSKHLCLWLAWARGLQILSLENRSQNRNVLNLKEAQPFIETHLTRSDKTLWQPLWQAVHKSVNELQFKLKLAAQAPNIEATQTLIVFKDKPHIRLEYTVEARDPVQWGLRLPLSVANEIDEMVVDNGVYAAWSTELQWNELTSVQLRGGHAEQIAVKVNPPQAAQWLPTSKVKNGGTLQILSFIQRNFHVEIDIQLAPAHK